VIFFKRKETDWLSILFRMKSPSYKLYMNEVLLPFDNQNHLQTEPRNNFSNTVKLHMTNPGEWGGKGDGNLPGLSHCEDTVKNDCCASPKLLRHKLADLVASF